MPVQSSPRVTVTAILAISLAACSVTMNVTGNGTVENLSPAQKQIREYAATLSKTVWETVANRSFFASITDMLINGRDKAEGPGLVRDRRGRYSTALTYIEETEHRHAFRIDQIHAIASDIRHKTDQATALVKATQLSLLDYQKDSPEALTSMSYVTTVRSLADLKVDLQIVEQSIASARKQQSTFEIIEQTYREKYPDSDTSSIKRELKSFGRQIDLIVVLSLELRELAIG